MASVLMYGSLEPKTKINLILLMDLGKSFPSSDELNYTTSFLHIFGIRQK